MQFGLSVIHLSYILIIDSHTINIIMNTNRLINKLIRKIEYISQNVEMRPSFDMHRTHYPSKLHQQGHFNWSRDATQNALSNYSYITSVLGRPLPSHASMNALHCRRSSSLDFCKMDSSSFIT